MAGIVVVGVVLEPVPIEPGVMVPEPFSISGLRTSPLPVSESRAPLAPSPSITSILDSPLAGVIVRVPVPIEPGVIVPEPFSMAGSKTSPLPVLESRVLAAPVSSMVSILESLLDPAPVESGIIVPGIIVSGVIVSGVIVSDIPSVVLVGGTTCPLPSVEPGLVWLPSTPVWVWPLV